MYLNRKNKGNITKLLETYRALSDHLGFLLDDCGESMLFDELYPCPSFEDHLDLNKEEITHYIQALIYNLLDIMAYVKEG